MYACYLTLAPQHITSIAHLTLRQRCTLFGCMVDLADVLKLMLSNEAALDALRDAEPLQRRATSTAIDRLEASVLPDLFVLETLSPATPQSLCTADEERASARVRLRVAGVSKASRAVVVHGSTWPPPSPAFRSRSLARATCYFQLAMILRYNHLMAEDGGSLARLCSLPAPPRRSYPLRRRLQRGGISMAEVGGERSGCQGAASGARDGILLLRERVRPLSQAVARTMHPLPSSMHSAARLHPKPTVGGHGGSVFTLVLRRSST